LLSLYPYQKEGAQELVKRRCVLLADEMGLGKTVQGAVAIKSLFEQSAIKRVLVVCPGPLTRNWISEIKKWANIAPVLYEGLDRHGLLMGSAKILVSSIETLTNDLLLPTSNGKNYFDIGVDLLLLDEAQRIKGFSALRSLVMSKILSGRRWAFSGTPLENRPTELASILRFLVPNEVGIDENEIDLLKLFKLRDLLMIRRTRKSINLLLPFKNKINKIISLSPSQFSEYTAEIQSIKNTLKNTNKAFAPTKTIVSSLNELRRICLISRNEESSKCDLLQDEIEEVCEFGKVVIFTSFPNFIYPSLAKKLKKNGCVLFTGNMTNEEKSISHNKFLNDIDTRVMLASLKAAGVGITWTVASFVYHLDVWWNPQASLQAEDRVYRIGQNKPVIVKQLACGDTIEETILQLQETKKEIFDIVVQNEEEHCQGAVSAVLEPLFN
jgi:SNF2 family DNA or RNA helicase